MALLRQRLNLEAGILHGFHYLGGRGLRRVHGQNLVGIGGVHLPVAGPHLLVEGGRNSLDAAAAIDGGFETKRCHNEEFKRGKKAAALLQPAQYKFTARLVAGAHSIIAQTDKILASGARKACGVLVLAAARAQPLAPAAAGLKPRPARS